MKEIVPLLPFNLNRLIRQEASESATKESALRRLTSVIENKLPRSIPIIKIRLNCGTRFDDLNLSVGTIVAKILLVPLVVHFEAILARVLRRVILRGH